MSTLSLPGFRVVERIGRGSFGVVHLCVDAHGKRVAIKTVQVVSGGVRDEVCSLSAQREEAALLALQTHRHIVRLHSTSHDERSVHIILEPATRALNDMLRELGQFNGETALRFLAHLLTGLEWAHSRGYMHRDISPANCLLFPPSAPGDVATLKLADWGQATRCKGADRRYTLEVTTLWYRAPEVLLGRDAYDCAVDLWAVGCVFGQLLLGVSLFPGDCMIGQIMRIFSALGTPDEGSWAGCTSLPFFQPEFPKWKAPTSSLPWPPSTRCGRAAERPSSIQSREAKVLDALLTYDPARRPGASQARELVREALKRQEAPAGSASVARTDLPAEMDLVCEECLTACS